MNAEGAQEGQGGWGQEGAIPWLERAMCHDDVEGPEVGASAGHLGVAWGSMSMASGVEGG